MHEKPCPVCNKTITKKWLDDLRRVKTCSPKCGQVLRRKKSVETRFWRNVDKQTCWEWTSSRTYDGYGYLQVGGKRVGAHRLSWVLHNGAIPDNLHVLHTCDNPRCVNPKHLFLGTNTQNIADRVAKSRTASKLTRMKVLQIRQSGGVMTQRQLGVRFGVCQSTIHHVLANKTWAECK